MSPAAIGRRTFAALANPNYRRWYAGQGISLIGTWMQTIAQGWLVYTLTGSGTQLGLVVALQMVPVLILAPYAGVVADRVDKRRLIIAVQGVMAVLALILGLLTVTGAVRLWEVYVLAAALGIATAFDNPARQSFVMELVGPDHVRNAVTLNSVLVNAARAVGPAVAGILIATVGVSVCFLVNAGSYVAVIASLLLLDRSALRPSIPAPRSRSMCSTMISACSGVITTIRSPASVFASTIRRRAPSASCRRTLPIFRSQTSLTRRPVRPSSSQMTRRLT